MLVCVKIMVCWCLLVCSSVKGHQHFRGTIMLGSEDYITQSQSSLPYISVILFCILVVYYISTKLHGPKSQKTVILIYSVVL